MCTVVIYHWHCVENAHCSSWHYIVWNGMVPMCKIRPNGCNWGVMTHGDRIGSQISLPPSSDTHIKAFYLVLTGVTELLSSSRSTTRALERSAWMQVKGNATSLVLYLMHRLAEGVKLSPIALPYYLVVESCTRPVDKNTYGIGTQPRRGDAK